MNLLKLIGMRLNQMTIKKRNKLDEVVPVAIILDGEGTDNPEQPQPPSVQKPRLKIDDTFFLMISPTAFLEIG